LKLRCRSEEFRGQDSIVGIDLGLVLAIAIPVKPQAARVSRAAALALRTAAFVDAARIASLGDSPDHPVSYAEGR
jgi:peptide/nickel transport system permease protein